MRGVDKGLELAQGGLLQFRIDLPKIHKRFRIGPPKMHRRFWIGPPQVSLNLLPTEFNRRGILLTIAIMKEKQQNNLFEI